MRPMPSRASKRPIRSRARSLAPETRSLRRCDGAAAAREREILVVHAVGFVRRAQRTLVRILRILERDANFDPRRVRILAARRTDTLRRHSRDRGIEEPCIDLAPRVLPELVEPAEIDDQRSIVDALGDLERCDRLQEDLGVAVLCFETDPGQRPLRRWTFWLLAVGVRSHPRRHTAVGSVSYTHL